MLIQENPAEIIDTVGKFKTGGPHLSSERRITILAALRENPNALQVAQKIGGVSDTAVRRIAKREGIRLTGNSKESKARRVAEKHAKIIEALKANPNGMKVARQMGISDSVAWKLAHKAGIELTAGKAVMGGPLLSLKRQEEVITALKENPNARAVTRTMGDVRYIVVLQLAKEAGIDLASGRSSARGPTVSKEKRQEVIEALRICSNAISVTASVGGICETTVRNIAHKEGIELIDGLKARGKSSLTAPRMRKIIRSIKAPNNSVRGVHKIVSDAVNEGSAEDVDSQSLESQANEVSLLLPQHEQEVEPPSSAIENNAAFIATLEVAEIGEMEAVRKWEPVLASLEQLKDKVKKKTARYPVIWNEPRDVVADHLIALIQQMIIENQVTVLGMSQNEKDNLCARAIKEWTNGTSQHQRRQQLPILSALNNLLYLDLGRPLFPQTGGGSPAQFAGSRLPYSF